MLFLNVPYEQKDRAKNLGAQWNPTRKKWFVNDRSEYAKFIEWINGFIVVKDSFFIVEGKRLCWKCRRETKVYAVGIRSEDIIDLKRPNNSVQKDTGYDLHIWSIDEDIPKEIKSDLSKKYGCKNKYSYTERRTYFANTCSHCDSLQGDFFLHVEQDGPFGYLNDSELKLYRYSLKEEVGLWLQINMEIAPEYHFLDRAKIVDIGVIGY